MDHSSANQALEQIIAILIKKINKVGDMLEDGTIKKAPVVDLAYQLADLTNTPHILCQGLIVHWLDNHPVLMCKKGVGITFREKRIVKNENEISGFEFSDLDELV